VAPAGIHQGYIVTGEVTPDEGGAAQVFKRGGGHVDTAAGAHADVTEPRAAGAEHAESGGVVSRLDELDDDGTGQCPGYCVHPGLPGKKRHGPAGASLWPGS
jgi:hypothetical protein